jgi:hypothetical protein
MIDVIKTKTVLKLVTLFGVPWAEVLNKSCHMFVDCSISGSEV